MGAACGTGTDFTSDLKEDHVNCLVIYVLLFDFVVFTVYIILHANFQVVYLIMIQLLFEALLKPLLKFKSYVNCFLSK